jgi:hypothetical protein
MTQDSIQVLEWVCPGCKKAIRSLYPSQFDYNKKLHENSCRWLKRKKKMRD